MISALQKRIMPSVYNGGMIFSDAAKNDMAGYQTRRIELTDADIKKLGISMLPDEISPVQKFDNRDITKGIKLSSGRQLTEKDKLNNVFYEDGKYFLDYDKHLSNEEFAKVLTSAGGRFTTNKNNFLDQGEFNFIAQRMGLGDMKIGALVEATKDDPRKLAAQTGETWEALF